MSTTPNYDLKGGISPLRKSTTPLTKTPSQGLSPDGYSSYSATPLSAVNNELRVFHKCSPQLSPPPALENKNYKPQDNIFDYDSNAEPYFSSTTANRTLQGISGRQGALRPSTANYVAPSSLPREDLKKITKKPVPQGRCCSAVNSCQNYYPKPTFARGEKIIERDFLTNKVLSTYICKKRIGAGGFAKVYLFVDMASGESFACKVIETSKVKENENKEIDLHRRLNHPNIVKLYKDFRDEYFYYILLELCSPKNLLDVQDKNPFPETDVAVIMNQLVDAVEHMHNRHIIHRDLKLGNILLDSDGNIKVADFGFSTFYNPSKDRIISLCGTPNYIAPEILEASETKVGYGFEVDMWSLGIIMYTLTVGTPPFQRNDVNSTYECIRKMNYTIPNWVSESCRQLITALLQRNPKLRPTPIEVKKSIFLRQFDKNVSIPRKLLASGITQRNMGPSPSTTSPILPLSPQTKGGPSGTETLSPCFPVSTFTGRLGKLPPPMNYAHSAVYCSSYGYGFILQTPQASHLCLYLNDRTKAVYDKATDKFYCYERVCANTVGGEGSNPQRVIRDELSIYPGAKQFFQNKCTDTNTTDNATVTGSDKNGKGNDSQIKSFERSGEVFKVAKKKYSITMYFEPYLQGTEEIPFCKSSLPPTLFQNAQLFCQSQGSQRVDPSMCYVKDCFLERYKGKVMNGGVDINGLVIRFSNGVYQITVKSELESDESMTPVADQCVVPRNEPWCLDLIIYGGKHALFGLNTSQSQVYITVEDIVLDSSINFDGKIFSAFSSTNAACRHFFVPTHLLLFMKETAKKLKSFDGFANLL